MSMPVLADATRETTARRRLLMAFAAFIALGLRDAATGASWPEMRRSFSQPVGSLAFLIVGGTIGYMAVSASSGALSARFGAARILGGACFVGAVCALGTALGALWLTLPILFLIAGGANGAIDAGMNTYVAARHSVKAMGLLHAFFGLGATVSPLVLSAALRAGITWRLIFIVAAVCFGAVAIGIAVYRHGWDLIGAQTGGIEHGAAHDVVPPAPRPRAVLGIALFSIYVAFEASIAQWSPSALNDARGATPAVAGLWVAGFWASFSLGRITLGWLVARLGEWRVLSWSVVLSVIGALAMWTLPGVVGAGLGIVTAGLGLGAIFPLHITMTIRRVGSLDAGRTIGRQIAAAGLGFAAGSALLGALVRFAGLRVLWPTLVVLGVAMAIIERIVRHAAGPEPGTAPA